MKLINEWKSRRRFLIFLIALKIDTSMINIMIRQHPGPLHGLIMYVILKNLIELRTNENEINEFIK